MTGRERVDHVVLLRLFLGATYLFAGVQKLADRRFLDPHAGASIRSQMLFIGPSTPLHSVVGWSVHYPVAVGLAIALGEIAVGLGTLAGLWTRVAAIGGGLIALGFVLTVTWHIRPYYEGADIVFLFAWTPLILSGDAGPFSLDRRWRRSLVADASVAAVPVEPAAARTYSRREVVDRVIPTLGLATIGVLVADVARLAAGPAPAARTAVTHAPGPAALPPPTRGPSTTSPPTTVAPAHATAQTAAPAAPQPTAAPSPQPSPSGHAAAQAQPQVAESAATSTTTTTAAAAGGRGYSIGPASNVPVGGAESFQDPASGDPANVVQPQQGQFVAFSAICTHAGCTVDFQKTTTLQGDRLEFDCPCHGARFDATTGQPISGPASRPLRSISVVEGADGNLYVDG